MEHGGVERLKTDHNNAARAIHNRAKRSRRINGALAAIAVSGGIMLGFAEKDPKNAAATAVGDAGALVALGTVAAAAGDDVLLRRHCRRVIAGYAESRDFAGPPGERIRVTIEDGDLRETTEFDEEAYPSPVLMKGLYGRLAGPVAPAAVTFGTSFLIDAGTSPLAVNGASGIGNVLGGGMIATGLGITLIRAMDVTALERSYIRQLENIDGPSSISVPSAS